MTPVQVQGDFVGILREALNALRAAPRLGVVLILLGWLTLAFGTEHWFLAVMADGRPGVALGSALFLLLAGTSMLLNASQLLVRPGAVVPQPPALASRTRRLTRVAGVEIIVAAMAATIIASVDTATSSSLARITTHQMISRADVAGVSPPALASLAAWGGYCTLHAPGQTWLWPALAANYPGGTLKATAILASRAGRRTPWLVNTTLGTGLTLTAATFLAHWSAAILVLALLLAWPALANTAAARVRPD